MHAGEDIRVLYDDLIQKTEKKLTGMRRADQTDNSTFRFYAGIMRELEMLRANPDLNMAEQD